MRYELLDCTPEDFAAALRRFIDEGGCGGNVTLPHKRAAREICTAVSADAERAGAINTFAVLEDGSLFGDNTDGIGLVRDLVGNHSIRIAGRRVLLVGAGGAARGALGPLLDEAPAELVVTNRTPEKAEALVSRFAAPGSRACAPEALSGRFDLVINATSASLSGHVPALPGHVIAEHGVAYDMFYSDAPTVFLDWARTHGAATCIDGWGMMVEQAAESFFVWRGVRPDTAALLKRV